jgi:mono/diheme cytochrome c family protein
MSGDDQPPKQFPPSGESRQTFEGNRFEDDALQRVHAQLLREKEEPSENFSYPPLVFVFLFMVLSFWAGVYLAEYSGDFGPFTYNEKLGRGVAEAAGPVVRDPLVEGKKIYVRQCLACHQSDGGGLPGVYPPVRGADWVQDNPERLVKLVLSGLQGAVVVNGNTYNNAMTAFGSLLNDRDIAFLLTYLRTAPEMGNDSFPVEEELVARVRAEYGSRSEAWTQPELEAIHGPVTGQWSPPAGAVPAAEAPASEEATSDSVEAPEA